MFRFLKSLVYAPKYEKESDMKFNKEISIAIFGIILCMICLTMSTWAYFTANVETPNQTIQASHYTVSVVLDANGQTVLPEDNGEYVLDPGYYTVAITGEGTASNGYARVVLEDDSFYVTSVVKPGETKTFCLRIADNAMALRFVGIFGTPAEPDVYAEDDPEHPEQTLLILQG